MWKVQTLFDKLNKQASRVLLPGKFVAIVKQMIGFEGRLGLKIIVQV
jgi:hypothetical protein